MMKLIVTLLSILVVCFSVNAKQNGDNTYWQSIEQTIQHSGFNGTIVVAQGDNVVLEKSIGYADAKQQIALTTKHLFSPGSVGKEFTTVSIMQLAANKQLDYKDKITKYVDGLPAWAQQITIEHVLTHTSGLPSVQWKKAITTDDAVQQIKQATLLFTPGSGYKYTNLNVVIRALIVESITGQRYADYVAATLFKAAGMTASFHQTKSVEPHRAVAAGDYPTNISGLTIYVTPSDLLKFEKALWNGTLLSAEALRQALPGDKLSGKTNRAYFDFGKYVTDDSGNLLSWQHDGSNPSHHTVKHHDFARDTVFILMSNDGNKSTLYKLLYELQKAVERTSQVLATDEQAATTQTTEQYFYGASQSDAAALALAQVWSY
ncbi:serine hydrolase domain-containing protein [Pseudoalteromonas maricaloris]|uniref:serine hydrolase domain-containing protein n=1 Tax=Pseudoalteromonas maricaloris TaxID=184924 RepID=UPI0009DA9C09|nr:serine hydrolase domain-containing protein [Pseudoalteromonas flavipulchra]